MKRTKKLITLVIVGLSMGTQIALADIPSGTALVGGYAYDLEYFNKEENFKEISSKLQENNYDIKVKTFNGKWIDNITGEELSTSKIPRVIYKDAKGEIVEFEEKDGKKIEALNEWIYLTSNKELKIKVPKEVDIKEMQEKYDVKVNGKRIWTECELKTSKDGTELTMSLDDNLLKNFKLENLNGKIGVHIEKGAKFEKIEIENPKVVVSEGKSSHGELVLSGEKKEVELSGDFSKVSINSSKDITMKSNSKVDLLIANRDITIKGDATVIIKEVQKDKDVKVEIKKQDNSLSLPTITEIGTIPSGGGGGVVVPPVSDTTKPTITLKGDRHMTLNVGDEYVEPGIVAKDDKDGDITSSVEKKIKNSADQIVQKVDTSKAETYTIEYNVSDKAGNKADTVVRTIVVKEKEVIPPVEGDGRVKLEINGYTVNITIEGKDIKPLVSIKIINHNTGALEWIDQGETGNKMYKCTATLSKPGKYVIQVNGFQGETVIKEFEIAK